MRETFLTNTEKSFVTKCIEERKVGNLIHYQIKHLIRVYFSESMAERWMNFGKSG